MNLVTSRRSVALIALVLLLLAVGGILALRDGPPPPESAGERGAGAVAIEGETPPEADESDEIPADPGITSEESAEAAAEKSAEESTTPDPEKGSVEGRLTFPDGRPVADRLVWLWGNTKITGRTDEDGRYRIDEEWTGRHGRGLMVGPKEAAVSAGEVHLTPGKTVTHDATIADGIDLVLEVFDRSEGKPAAGIWLALDAIPWVSGGPFAAGTTDEDGRVGLSLVPKIRWRVRIDAEGYRGVREELDLTAADPATSHRILLERSNPLVLRVIPSPGEGTLVNLHLLPDPPKEGMAQFPYVGNLDADGLFRGDAPPPGNYRVILHLDGLGNREIDPIEVLPRQAVEIVAKLPEGSGVAGTIHGPDDQPLARATIELVPLDRPGPGIRAKPTGEDGAFSLPTVRPGRYDLHVVHDGQIHMGIVEPIRVGTSGATGLRLRLPRGGTVAGKIVGAPNPKGIWIQLDRREGDRWVCGGVLPVAHDGSFVGRHLRPGMWRVDARAFREDAGWTPPVEVEVRDSGPPHAIELRWKEPATVVLHLVGGSGEPYVRRLQGHATTEDGKSMPRILVLNPEAEGRVELKSIRPGRYVLRLFHSGGGKPRAEVDLDVKEGVNEPVRVRIED